MEGTRRDGSLSRRTRRQAEGRQLGLFDDGPDVTADVLGLDVTAMTPIEAINALYALQQKARGQE